MERATVQRKPAGRSGWSLRRRLLVCGAAVALCAGVALLAGHFRSEGGDPVATIDPDTGLPFYPEDPVDFDLFLEGEMDAADARSRAQDPAPVVHIAAAVVDAIMEDADRNNRMLAWEVRQEEALLLRRRLAAGDSKPERVDADLPLPGRLHAGSALACAAGSGGFSVMFFQTAAFERLRRTPRLRLSGGHWTAGAAVIHYHSIRNGYADGYYNFVQKTSSVLPTPRSSSVFIHSSSFSNLQSDESLFKEMKT